MDKKHSWDAEGPFVGVILARLWWKETRGVVALWDSAAGGQHGWSLEPALPRQCFCVLAAARELTSSPTCLRAWLERQESWTRG